MGGREEVQKLVSVVRHDVWHRERREFSLRNVGKGKEKNPGGPYNPGRDGRKIKVKKLGRIVLRL